MTHYQKLEEYHDDILKAERCFRLMDEYLDTNYVEEEEGLRIIINAALSNAPEMREIILERINSSAARKVSTASIERFLKNLSEMLAHVNRKIFDALIIGYDIIDKYYLSED